LKTGWRPSRTIVLALWDGEEWGLLGSTEWAEKHDAELKQKAAVYINTDGTGKGWLNAGGSHGLQQFMGEAAKDVMDPRTGKPIFEEARRRAVLAEAEDNKKAAEADPSLRIAPLGSGSDFTPFLQHLTLSALSVGFGGESPGGVYHSAYDTIKWYQTYSDTDYSYGAAPQTLLALRLIVGEVASLDMAGKAFFVHDVAGGNDRIYRGDVSFTVPIYKQHSIAAKYLWNRRDATSSNLGDRTQTRATFGVFYSYIGKERFGAVDWR